MAREIKETRTQPQRMVTDWPSVRVMYIVVLRPKGTAMMAKELCTLARRISRRSGEQRDMSDVVCQVLALLKFGVIEFPTRLRSRF